MNVKLQSYLCTRFDDVITSYRGEAAPQCSVDWVIMFIFYAVHVYTLLLWEHKLMLIVLF